jgi:hypothetical protein
MSQKPIEGVDNGVAGYGVLGRSNKAGGHGVVGESNLWRAVGGYSKRGPGVYGHSYDSHGIRGFSESRHGVHGESYSSGVYGFSPGGNGVRGESLSVGVYGIGGSQGSNGDSIGVSGESYFGTGVVGGSFHGVGMRGWGVFGTGVYGSSREGIGVYGEYSGFRSEGSAVNGKSIWGRGVWGHSDWDAGVYGTSARGRAGFFKGNVEVTGSVEVKANLAVQGKLTKASGSFKIDHPLDPANKYLYHSFVESPDMKNVYDGLVVLDDKGEAEIDLPDWFGALNKDFRYQLTAVGTPGPNLYIADEISDARTSNVINDKGKFKIAGGAPGMKVSWQVTGIRIDPWANANRIQVEEDKPAKEQGYFLYPSLYGQPKEKGIDHLLFPGEESRQEQLVHHEAQ